MASNPKLTPLLVVNGAHAALDFYSRALGARVLARYEHGAERRISHADVAVADTSFSVTEEACAWNSDAPSSLGGSPVVLQLHVAAVDAILASMCEAGARVVFPVQTLIGERMARVCDPFGHIWLLRQPVRALPADEIQRQRDALFDRIVRNAPASAGQPHLESPPTLYGPAGVRQGPAAQPPRATPARCCGPARIHLVLGPVGAGKSTFAQKLADSHSAVRLTLDEWAARLFQADRPAEGVMQWYVERAARCVEQIWEVARQVLSKGSDVVLEIGLLRRVEREAFYERVDRAGLPITLYFLHAAREVRRQRVAERNRTRGETFSMVVPPEIFELASDHWEPPADDEGAGRDILFIRTDGSA